MSIRTLSTGRTLVDPLKEESIPEELESTSHSHGGTHREDRVVDNTDENYGNCPKCSTPMPLVKNAQRRSVFFCEKCRTASPCKE